MNQKKKTMKRSIIITALLTLAVSLSAQEVIRLTGTKNGTDTQVSVKNIQVARTTEKTLLTMDFILDQLDVPSNRYRAFTPVIRTKDGQHEQRLKTLIVSGRRQNIVFERDGIDPLYVDNCDNIRRLNGQPQTYAYTDAVQNQPWHRNADVYVECDLCGCGDLMKNEQAYLASLLPPDPYDLIMLTDVVPDPYKPTRQLHGTAFINFVVNKWEMRPDYMDNRNELRKITDTLDIMVRDKNVTVRQIKIHGWASPESPYEHNRMLATNRAKSLTDWVRQQYSLPTNVFAPAEATPENWEGLRKAVVEMDLATLPHRSEILALIDDNTIEPDPKEQKIKKLYPAEYEYLHKNVYPHLRRSDYEISFDIRNFTLDEAKEVYKVRPYQLSLRELWDVANTFEKGSAEYNRALQTAVNQYPDSAAALINLANVAIRQKDLLKAETLLQRAGDSAEADQARAVVAIIQQRYDEAERLLAAAERKGLDVTVNRAALQEMTK
jgi:hypothetical protein